MGPAAPAPVVPAVGEARSALHSSWESSKLRALAAGLGWEWGVPRRGGMSSLLGSHGLSREECLSWLAWLQPASSRLLSVAGPWALCLQCCGPGKGPALGSWAQRSLCPGPSVLPCLPPLRDSRDRAACKSWHHSALPAMPAFSASAGHSGWGTAGPSQPVGAPCSQRA